MRDMRLVWESRYFLRDSAPLASACASSVTHVCACALDVMEKGLGSVPVAMNSPQSKVNTAALFSSQPSAGSPQARAGDHTPRPHTHMHTHALPRTLFRFFLMLAYARTTQHQLRPLARKPR